MKRFPTGSSPGNKRWAVMALTSRRGGVLAVGVCEALGGSNFMPSVLI
jgi:hypothetical protein